MFRSVQAKIAGDRRGREDTRRDTFREGLQAATSGEVEVHEAAELTEPFGE
jgi:hypothetical protein